jgi:hypothetical protein
MLPGCPGGQVEKDLHLPTGYHSLYVPAITDVECPMLAPDLPAHWADNYFVPNSSQVLVTHLVTYTTQAPEVATGPMFTPRTLQAMPAVVDECKVPPPRRSGSPCPACLTRSLPLAVLWDRHARRSLLPGDRYGGVHGLQDEWEVPGQAIHL